MGLRAPDLCVRFCIVHEIGLNLHSRCDPDVDSRLDGGYCRISRDRLHVAEETEPCSVRSVVASVAIGHLYAQSCKSAAHEPAELSCWRWRCPLIPHLWSSI